MDQNSKRAPYRKEIHMPKNSINGAEIYWEQSSKEGEPMVLVHGSWGDHYGWEFLVPKLSDSFRIITYDRRGHSQSPPTPNLDLIEDDVSDLEALIESLKLGKTHVVGNSFGAVIALKLAAKRPDLFKSLIIHEPPLFGVADDPFAVPSLSATLDMIKKVVGKLKQEKMEDGVKIFIEALAGPDAWDLMPEPVQQGLIYNAPTFLEENLEKEWYRLNFDKLATFSAPALLTKGSESPEFLIYIADELAKKWPHIAFNTIEGTDHIPHSTHPDIYAELIKGFIQTII